MNNEAEQLTDEYNGIVQTTSFNGNTLFTQSWQDVFIQAGSGTGSTLRLQIGDDLATKIAPGSYFRLEGLSASSQQLTPAYVWFTVDGVGTDPLAGGTGIKVDLFSQSGDNPQEITNINIPDATTQNSGYFTISAPIPGMLGMTTTRWVWFDVNGMGVRPGGAPLGQDIKKRVGNLIT